MRLEPAPTYTEPLTPLPEETEPARPSSVQIVLETAVIESGVFLSPPVGRIVYFLRINAEKTNKPFTDNSLITGEPLASETDLLNQPDGDQETQQQNRQSKKSVEGWFDLSDKDAGFKKIEERDKDDKEKEDEGDLLDDNIPTLLLEDEADQLIDDLEMADRIGLLSVLDSRGNLFDDVAAQLESNASGESSLKNGPGTGASQYFSFLAQSQFAALGIPVLASGQGNYITIQFLAPQGDADKSLAIKRSLYQNNFQQLGDADKDKFKWPPMRVILRWVFAALTALCLVLIFFGGGTEAIVATLLFSSLTAITFINFSYFFPSS